MVLHGLCLRGLPVQSRLVAHDIAGLIGITWLSLPQPRSVEPRVPLHRLAHAGHVPVDERVQPLPELALPAGHRRNRRRRGATPRDEHGEDGGDALPQHALTPDGQSRRSVARVLPACLSGDLEQVLDPDRRSRSRRPVAWKTALAIAGATPVITTSPRPLTPALLNVEVRLVDELDLDLPISAFTGTTYSARSALRKPPYRGSTSLASRSVAPMPHTTPPRTWLSAVRGLTTRPQSTTLTTRGTRTRRVPGSTRTSTKCATKLK